MGSYTSNIAINETFILDSDCYTFNLIDDFGNGGSTVSLKDANNNILFSASGNYGRGISKSFSVSSTLNLYNSNLKELNIYPNPTKNQFTIANAEGFNVSLYSILGKEILTKQSISNNEVVNTNNLSAGTYFVKIHSDNTSRTEKIVIIK